VHAILTQTQRMAAVEAKVSKQPLLLLQHTYLLKVTNYDYDYVDYNTGHFTVQPIQCNMLS